MNKRQKMKTIRQKGRGNYFQRMSLRENTFFTKGKKPLNLKIYTLYTYLENFLFFIFYFKNTSLR